MPVREREEIQAVLFEQGTLIRLSMESLGILSQTTNARRDRVYCARAIMDILDEPANLTPSEKP
jgi:hypothetical protein